MTKVPKAGDVYTRRGTTATSAVLFADEETVLVRRDVDGSRETYHSLYEFLRRYKPAPRVKTWRKWLVLYNTGHATMHDTEIDAEGHQYAGAVEVREIAWEANL